MTSKPSTTTESILHINGLRILLIYVGIFIALPAFVMGIEINTALGARQALMACIFGGALLALIAILAGIVGARSRKSTYELVVDAFGEHGARFVNGLISLSQVGWFAVVAALFGNSLGSLLKGTLAQVVPLWTVLGAVLVIVTLFWGFKALDRIAWFLTPLKLALLLWVVAVALGNGWEPVLAAQAESSMSLGNGISLVGGGLFVGAILAPDFCRHARNGWHAAIACLIAFGVWFPTVLMLSGVAALATGERDLIRLMVVLGLGAPALLTVLLTAWQTNSGNLYSASLAAHTIWPARRWRQVVLAAGTLGTLLALSGWTSNITGFMTLMSLAIPPVAAIYLVHYISAPLWPAPACRWRMSALLTWCVGVALAAVLKWNNASITGIPALDAFLCAALVYAILQWRTSTRRLRQTAPALPDSTG